jgi:hypothetical protein
MTSSVTSHIFLHQAPGHNVLHTFQNAWQSNKLQPASPGAPQHHQMLFESASKHQFGFNNRALSVGDQQ